MLAISYRASVALQAVVFLALIVIQVFAGYIAFSYYDFGWYATNSGLVKGTPPMAVPCIASFIGGAFSLQGLILEGWLKRRPMHWFALLFAAIGLVGVGLYGVHLMMAVLVIVTR